MKKNRMPTMEYSAAQALFWMNLCVYISYAAVYLQALGYSNARLGLVVGCGNILSFIISITFSSAIDKHPKFRAGDAVNIQLCVQAVMIAVLWFSKSRGPVTSITYVLYVGFAAGVSSMLIKQWSDLQDSGYIINFGTSRAVGSGGYVLLCTFLGVAVERRSTDILLIVSAILTILQLIVNMALNSKISETKTVRVYDDKGSSLGVFLKENHSFTVILAGLILIFFAHNTSGYFFINIVNNLGGDTSDMGYLNAVIAVIEIPAMLAYHRICRNRKLSRVLAFSLLMFPLKQLAYALSPSMPILYVSTIMQMLSFALYTPAIVDYVGTVIPARDTAKGQTLAYGMSTVGSVFASFIGGLMYDSISIKGTLLIASGVCAIGALLCVSVLRINEAR